CYGEELTVMKTRHALGMALLLVACTSAYRVTAADAKKLVQEGATLVDVRSPEEFAAEHIDGAVNIPVSELGTRMGELGPKDKPVVVYCMSGIRSARAANTLAEAGFKKVADLGKMSSWEK